VPVELGPLRGLGVCDRGPRCERHRHVDLLWIGVVWVVVTTLIVISVRDVRDFRLEPIGVDKTELAPAIAAS
jgi:hypothetical protein